MYLSVKKQKKKHLHIQMGKRMICACKQKRKYPVTITNGHANSDLSLLTNQQLDRKLDAWTVGSVFFVFSVSDGGCIV